MSELVLNHLLFFISNKIHSLDKERILDISAKFYTDFEEINDAKRLLCEKAKRKFTPRRSDDKTAQTLGDIYDIFLSADKDGISLPIFVASDVTRFPQTSDGVVNLEQILHTMNRISSRLNGMEKNYVTKEFLTGHFATNDIMAETNDPVSALRHDNSVTSEVERSTDESGSSSGGGGDGRGGGGAGGGGDGGGDDDGVLTHVTSGGNRSTGPSSHGPALRGLRGRGGGYSNVVRSGSIGRSSQRSNSVSRSSNTDASTNKNSRRQIFIGSKVSNGEVSWGGNDLMSHWYVGNVKTNVTTDDIKKDFESRGICGYKIELNRESDYSKSFKISFKRDDDDKIADGSFWPKGVIYRRWHNPRAPRQTGSFGSSGSASGASSARADL